MAWRITARDVQEIVETDPALSLSRFINTANALTDYVSSKDSLGVLTAALLREIEEYLAAHFYSHRDQLFQEKSTGKASAVFQGKTDMGLASTQYGQTAMDLDVSGTLRSLAKGKASLVWLGLPPSEQTAYADRD